jgi:hypothetical protein
MDNEKLALFDDSKAIIENTLAFTPQLAGNRLLETDIVTMEEIQQYPNKVMVGDIEIEVEVPDYETVTEEYEEPIYSEDGEIIGYETKTYEKTIQTGSHKEIITVKGLVLNPDFETEQAQKEAERIAMLYLTAADVERGIYKAKRMDFDDIINLVSTYPQEGLDIKALKIELKANNFYRGNPYVNAIGALLGFTEEQLNKFFEDGNYEHLLNVNNSEQGEEENPVVEDVTDVEDVNKLEEESK